MLEDHEPLQFSKNLNASGERYALSFSFSMASNYLLLQLANACGGLGRGHSSRSGLGGVRGGRRIGGHMGGGAELGLQIQNSTSLECKF
jgi:hypothetical protein